MELETGLQQPTSQLNNGALAWLSSSIQQYFLNRSINTHQYDQEVECSPHHVQSGQETPSSGKLQSSPPQSDAGLLSSRPLSSTSPPSSTTHWGFIVFMESLSHVHVNSLSSPSPPPSSFSSPSRSEEPKGGSRAPPWTPPKPKLMKAASTRNSLNDSPKPPSKKPTLSNLHTSSPPSPNQNPSSPSLHPVFEILHEQQLGKSILVLAIPMIIALYSFYGKSLPTPLLWRLPAIFLSLGVALIWNGILLRRTCNTYSQLIELLGIIFMFSAFYVFVSCFLPNWLILVPGLCWISTLLPFFIAFCTSFRGRGRVGSDEESIIYPEV